MIAEVPQDSVEPGGVQLGIVNEEEDEEAREPLMVEQLTSSELGVAGSSHHLDINQF